MPIHSFAPAPPLAIFRQIEHKHWEGTALDNLGSIYATLGDARRALECYEEQLAIAQEIGDRRGEANALFNSALSLWKRVGPGERDEARRRVAAAAALFEAMESPNAAKARAVLEEWGS